MRACVIASTGNLDRIERADVPEPSPDGLGPRRVRVANRAAAVNHLEFFVIRGLLPVKYRYPHVVGSDGAGVMEGTVRSQDHRDVVERGRRRPAQRTSATTGKVALALNPTDQDRQRASMA
jgi:NADPH:quinone reductase-like Zn-dependent oxidoreductase